MPTARLEEFVAHLKESFSKRPSAVVLASHSSEYPSEEFDRIAATEGGITADTLIDGERMHVRVSTDGVRILVTPCPPENGGPDEKLNVEPSTGAWSLDRVRARSR